MVQFLPLPQLWGLRMARRGLPLPIPGLTSGHGAGYKISITCCSCGRLQTSAYICTASEPLFQDALQLRRKKSRVIIRTSVQFMDAFENLQITPLYTHQTVIEWAGACKPCVLYKLYSVYTALETAQFHFCRLIFSNFKPYRVTIGNNCYWNVRD